jgi:hypothetical protein
LEGSLNAEERKDGCSEFWILETTEGR